MSELLEQPDFAPVTLTDADMTTPDAGTPATPVGQQDDGDTIEALAKEALGTPPDATPEEIEIEWEGVKAKVPPQLRDAFLRHQDYTRKTMDLAAQRKVFEQESQTFGQSAAQIAANLQDVVELASVNKEIQRLTALDTTGWSQAQIQQGLARLQGLQLQAGQLGQTVNQRAQQAQHAESQKLANLRERAIAEAAAKIPNFTDKRRAELEQFAVQAGADPEVINTLSDSWAFEMLHWADIGRKFIERQSKVATITAANAGTPARTIGGKFAGTKSPDDMSFEEYAAWREAGNG